MTRHKTTTSMDTEYLIVDTDAVPRPTFSTAANVQPSQTPNVYDLSSWVPSVLQRSQEATTRRTYVLCVHHDEPIEDLLHERHQPSQSEEPASAEKRKRLGINREIQT